MNSIIILNQESKNQPTFEQLHSVSSVFYKLLILFLLEQTHTWRSQSNATFVWTSAFSHNLKKTVLSTINDAILWYSPITTRTFSNRSRRGQPFKLHQLRDLDSPANISHSAICNSSVITQLLPHPASINTLYTNVMPVSTSRIRYKTVLVRYCSRRRKFTGSRS